MWTEQQHHNIFYKTLSTEPRSQSFSHRTDWFGYNLSGLDPQGMTRGIDGKGDRGIIGNDLVYLFPSPDTFYLWLGPRNVHKLWGVCDACQEYVSLSRCIVVSDQVRTGGLEVFQKFEVTGRGLTIPTRLPNTNNEGRLYIKIGQVMFKSGSRVWNYAGIKGTRFRVGKITEIFQSWDSADKRVPVCRTLEKVCSCSLPGGVSRLSRREKQINTLLLFVYPTQSTQHWRTYTTTPSRQSETKVLSNSLSIIIPSSGWSPTMLTVIRARGSWYRKLCRLLSSNPRSGKVNWVEMSTRISW